MDFPLSNEQVQMIAHGDLELDDEIYDTLYAYYTNPARGPDTMPYGTAKARDGDPYNWIGQQIYLRACENDRAMGE
jgi:hypothetical protein